MAKKENLSSGRTDLDSNFDDFDFDFDAPPVKDDRNPVTKLATGALAGAKTAATQSAFIRDSIRAVLPEGYGLAMDLQDEVSKKSKELYNNAVKEVKPIAAAMSSAADKLLPAGATRLKAKLGEINKWAKDSEKRFSYNGKEDNEKASIAASINETFKFQMEQEVKESVRAESRERLQEGLALTRHRDDFGMLNRINFGITRLAQYQDKVTAAYQKKSLELQYRSLFTSIDILQESKRQNAFTSEALASITKNTSLPDFVKLSEGDRLEGLIRNKFAKTIGASILGGKDNPLTQFSEHISKVFNEKLKDMVGVLSSSAEIVTGLAEVKEANAGQDGYTSAGKGIGEQAAGMIRKALAPYAKKYLPKYLPDNNAKITGSIKNGSRSLDKFKSGSYGEKDGAIKAFVFKTIKEFIPSFGTKVDVEKDNIGDLTKPAIYTKQTNKSINEIIPGYLSRIFRELQVMRTGDTKIGLTVYDNQSSKFQDRKTADKNLLNSVLGKSSVEPTKDQVKGVLERLDPDNKLSRRDGIALAKKTLESKGVVETTKDQMQGILKLVDPKGKLSPEAATALVEKTLRDNLAGKTGTADRTAHEFTYLDDEKTKPHAKEIATLMQEYFGSNKSGKIKNNNESHEKQNAFTDKQRNLGSGITDIRGQIQNLINLGNHEDLERVGLIKYTKEGGAQVNLENLIDYSMGKELEEKDDDALEPLAKSKDSGSLKASTSAKRSVSSARQPVRKKQLRSGNLPQRQNNILPGQAPTTQQPQQIHQQSNNAELIKMMSESSVKEEMTQAVSTLDKIQQILLESNVAQEAYFNNLIENVKAIGYSTSNPGAAGANAADDGKKNNGNIFQGTSINLRNFLGKTTKTIGSLFSIGNKIGMSGLKTGGTVIGAAFSVGKKVINTTGNILSRIGQKKELFVEGEDEPRIRSDLLKAGKYFNKKGKVYKSLDDINNTVYDADGMIVITKEELKNSYVKSKRGSGVFKIVKFAGGLISDAVAFGTGLIPPVFKMALNTAKFIFNTGKNLLDSAQDIYIRGVEDPVMLKRTMVAGGYFLKSDMTVVKRPSQITGTIVNASGEVVLSEENLRSGIRDKDGNPIKSPLGKLLNFATGALKLGVRLGVKAVAYSAKSGMKVLKAGFTGAKKVLGIGGKFLGGGLGSFTKNNQAGSSDGSLGDNYQTLDVLERIFKVLDSRLPAKANRKGSWQDVREKRPGSTRAADSINAASKGSIGDGLLDKGKSLLERVADRSDNRTLTIENNKLPGPATPGVPGATPLQPKGGFWNKTKNLGKNLMKGKTGAILGIAGSLGLDAVTSGAAPGSIGSTIGTVADVAGTASTIYNIGKFVLPAAEVAGAALSTGAVAGGAAAAGGAVATGVGVVAAEAAGATALAAGGTGIGASLLTGLGALATGVGAIIGSPVVLGALAVAAVGTAAYFTYQYFKKTEFLKNLRAVQYGFSEKNDKGGTKAYALEDMLKDALYFKEGTATIDPKKFDQKKALGLFGINEDDSKALNTWLYWFQNRFKPVYLTHLTALRTVDDKAKISDVDDLKVELKDKLLELVKFQEGPYEVNLNPVSGSWYKLTTRKDVSDSFDIARKGIDAEMKKDKTSGNSLVTGSAIESGVTNKDTPNQTDPNRSTTGVASDTNKVTSKDYTKDSGALGATKGVALAISSRTPELVSVNIVDTLEGIRMRSYGLTTMESDKVSALRRLENLIILKVQYGGDGLATYKADSVDTLVAGGMFFGVTTGSDLAQSWSKWFQIRFLPVYLSYLSLIKQSTNTPLKAGTVPSLTAVQALSIATQFSSIDSAWSVKDSPWSLYKLGTDQSIVKELIETLRQNSKQATMQEAAFVKSNVPTSSVSNTDSKENAVKAVIENKGGATNNAPPAGGSDAENVEMNRAPVGSVESLNGTSGLTLAGGPLSDGRNASAYLKIATGATLKGLNPEFLKNFNSLVDEYGTLTGQSTLLNSGFRSYEKQAELYKADPSKAARPGSSLHEVGLAVDVQSSILNDMDKRGLLRKYGFTRPVGGEPWHLEPTGIQGDISGFRNNPDAASKAIQAGIGKGGGGYGTMADATKYKRNGIVAKQILDAAVSPTTDKPPVPVIPDKAQIAGTTQPGVATSLGKYTPTLDEIANGAVSKDSEAPIPTTGVQGKTKAEMLGSAPNGRTANAAGFTPTVTANSTKSSVYGSSPNTKGGGTGNMMPALQATVPSTGAKYDSIPASTGTGWGSNKDMIVAAANAVGIDPKYMAAIGAIESGFDPAAANPGGKAKGLNQFMPETWTGMMKSDGGKYGIPPGATALDAKANAILGSAYVKQNLSALSGVKSNITGTDVYMAHFLGATGAKNFLNADPNAIGAQVLPKSVPGNEPIFYDTKNANRPRTISEIYSLLDNRMQAKLKQFGVDASYIPTMTGLVAKNTSTTGLEVRSPSIGLNANTPSVVPGIVPGATPTVQQPGSNIAPVSTGPGAPSVGPMMPPMADIGGFNMQGAQQPLQNPKQDMTAAIGDMGSTLTKSLNVQTQMLEVLQNIAKMSGTASPLQQPSQQPSQQGSPKVQTTDQGPVKSESQQQQSDALRSYNQASNKINVPVPMNRV